MKSGQSPAFETTTEVEVLAKHYRVNVPVSSRDKALAERSVWEALPKESRSAIIRRDSYNSKWLPAVLKVGGSTTDFIARDRLLKAEEQALPVEFGWTYLDRQGKSSLVLKALSFAKKNPSRYEISFRGVLEEEAPKSEVQEGPVAPAAPELVHHTRPVNVPNDYRELCDVYHHLIADAANSFAVDEAVLVQHLQSLRVVENFDLASAVPLDLSFEEAIAYLGVTPEFWVRYLQTTENTVREEGPVPWRHPRVIKGDSYKDPSVVFCGRDIHAIAEGLDEKNKARKRPVCGRIAEKFRHHLLESLQEAKSLLQKAGGPKPAKVAEENCPADLPRNDSEMFIIYGEYVFQQVSRISKVKTEEELEEVSQQLWFNLIQSNVLGKFKETARTKLPRTLTLGEAIGYLGVTKEQWTEAVELSRKDKTYWMPNPVQAGSMVSEDALFLTVDIQTLDESSHFMAGSRQEVRRRPEMTGRGFKSYLLTSINNHFKNLLRQRSRRHKERPADPRAVFSPDSAGSYRRTATLEDGTNWEESISDTRDPTMEDMVDLVDKLRKYDVDPRSEKGMFVLDHIARGHTIRDALKAYEKGGHELQAF